MNILIIQTAFAGDLILTLPLIQESQRLFPGSSIDVLCIPGTAELLRNHPAVREAIVYDKRRGSENIFSVGLRLRQRRFEVCISPHRSFRSALLAFMSGAPRRIAFNRSAGLFFYSDIVPYERESHEIVRNLSLLYTFGEEINLDCQPMLFPGEDDFLSAERALKRISKREKYICIAPGSVWATKRWTTDKFIETSRALSKDYGIVLIGGTADRQIADEIAEHLVAGTYVNAVGETSLLTSAVLIRDSVLLISNDSAPVHIASAMRTPVVEIFGATVPEFGFTPFGVPHRIIQLNGLPCKPCGIHGGKKCPIKTFECMKNLPAEWVIQAAKDLLREVSTHQTSR